MKKAKISICMATFNGADFILHQINSIYKSLKHSNVFYEFIIVDDCSTDNTVNIVKNNFPDITIYLNNTNMGHCQSFIKAINLSTGDYIFLSDQDDIWLKDKVSLYLDLLNDYDLVYGNGYVTDVHLNKQGLISKINPIEPHSLKTFIKNRTFVGCTMAFNNKIRDSLIVPKIINPHHDWFIGMISYILKYKIYYISKPLFLFRRHKNNMTSVHESKNNLLKIIWYRIQFVIAIFTHYVLLRLKMFIS